MLKEIIAGLVLFIITAVLTFIWRRVSIKPVINIYLETDGPSSSTSAPAYTGISGRRNRKHPDFKPGTSGHLSIDLIL